MFKTYPDLWQEYPQKLQNIYERQKGVNLLNGRMWEFASSVKKVEGSASLRESSRLARARTVLLFTILGIKIIADDRLIQLRYYELLKHLQHPSNLISWILDLGSKTSPGCHGRGFMAFGA